MTLAVTYYSHDISGVVHVCRIIKFQAIKSYSVLLASICTLCVCVCVCDKVHMSVCR